MTIHLLKTKLLLLLLSVIFALALCELLLRLFPSVVWQNSEIGIFDQVLGQRGNPAYEGHDNNGFRNFKTYDHADIITLGDSQTYGSQVSLSQIWSQQLASLSNLSVYSMSFPGYGPVHYLLLLDQAKVLKPKIIIATFYSGNDLYDSYSHVYRQGQLASLKTNDLTLLQSIAKQEDTEPLIRRIIAESHVNYWVAKNYLQYPAKYAKVYQLATGTVKNLLYQTNLSFIITKSQARFTTDKLISFESSQNNALFTPNYRLLTLDTADQRIAEGLRITKEVFNRANIECQNSQIKFVTLLIPTKELAYAKLVEASGKILPQNYHRQIEKEQEIFNNLKAYLQETQISFIDSLPTLEAAITVGEKPFLDIADGHLSQSGHFKIAQLLSSRMKLEGDYLGLSDLGSL